MNPDLRSVNRLTALFLLFAACSFCYGRIDGMIIKTTDSSYEDRWHKTLGENVPRIAGTDKIFKGQKLFIGVAVQNYELDNRQTAHVTYNLKITGMNGKVILEKKDSKAITSAGLNPDFVQLSEEFSTLTLKNNDAFGRYQISIHLFDRLNGSTKQLETTVHLVPLPDVRTIGLTAEENYWQWKNNYYNKKEPEKALSYFVFFTQSELPQKRSELLSAIAFFRTIFRENRILLTEFKDAYTESDEETRFLLALLLYHSTNEDSFSRYMNDSALLEQVQQTKIPLPDQEITQAEQIEMLWSEFSASGRQEPVSKIISVLDRNQNAKVKSDKETGETLFKAARESLKERLPNEPLALGYAQWILANGNLSGKAKRELTRILKQASR